MKFKTLKNKKIHIALILTISLGYVYHQYFIQEYLFSNSIKVSEWRIFQLVSIDKSKTSNSKNTAYLSEIKNGCKFIYDGEIFPTFNISDYFIYDAEDYGLIYDYTVQSRQIINVLAHFGQPLLTQRGNPFDQEIHNNSYYVGKRKTSSIQHAIFNGRPDLRQHNENTDIQFDNVAPSFQLPLGKMGVYNSRSTLYRYRAFWALYLPSTAPKGFEDIWRAFWSQRLMWLIGETVTFIGPKYHYYYLDSSITTNIDLRIIELIDFLIKWDCKMILFQHCILDLSRQMAANRFWSIEEVKLIENWLNDLNQIGYKLPKLAANVSNDIYNDRYLYSRVRFTPKFQTAKKNSYIEFEKKLESFTYLNEFCQASNYTLGNLTQFLSSPYQPLLNYTLLVTFNTRVFEKSLLIWHHLLDSHFENVVFCGARIIDVLNEQRSKDAKKFDSFTFIEYDPTYGRYHYICMNKVIEMGYYKTAGILLTSDDIIIKPWNLKSLNSSKIWYPQPLRPFLELRTDIKKFNWMWWPENVPLLKNLFRFISELAVGNKTGFTPKEVNMTREFISTFDGHRIKQFNVAYGGSDIFYLPKSKFEIYHFMARLFLAHSVFLETSVPNILIGIDKEHDIEIMNGIYSLSGSIRLENYENFQHFAHPFKIGALKGKDSATQYCKLHIQKKFDSNI